MRRFIFRKLRLRISRFGECVHMIQQGIDGARQPSFSLGNRAARVAWRLTYLALFRPSPIPLHAWRSCLLRLFGAKIGSGVHIYPKVDVWAPWNLVVGDFAGVANGVSIYSMATISLGERCVISQGAHLCAGSHDYNDPTFQLFAKPIEVGRFSWICADAFVGPGVTIPEGAVVGARSVVARSLSTSWSVYAGMPARKIGPRQKQT